MNRETIFDYEKVHTSIRRAHQRNHFAGLVRDIGRSMKAFCANPQCPASGLNPALRVDTDPFSGRLPSASELEAMFNDDLRTKYKKATPLPPPMELSQQTYILTNRRGQEHRALVYMGECPDCGVLLYAIVNPESGR